MNCTKNELIYILFHIITHLSEPLIHFLFLNSAECLLAQGINILSVILEGRFKNKKPYATRGFSITFFRPTFQRESLKKSGQGLRFRCFIEEPDSKIPKGLAKFPSLAIEMTQIVIFYFTYRDG